MTCPKCKAPLEAHAVTDKTTVDACPKCYGVFYDKDELAVALKLDVLAESGLGCPRCGKRMKVGQAAGATLVVDQCPGCGGIWFDMGEIQTLRKLAGVEQIAASDEPAPNLGPSGGVTPLDSAAAPAGAPANSKDSTKARKPVGKAPQPPDMSNESNPDASTNPAVLYEGLRYAHFQTSIPVTTHVLGEFPWLAAAGDRVRARDFIAPPFMLSNEVSEGESVWSRGEYVSGEEVWAAFGPKDRLPPSPRGVAPAQPNPWQTNMESMGATFQAALLAAMILSVGVMLIASEKKVYYTAFEFAATDVEKSKVSDVFELPGRTSNVQVKVDSNLDNRWAYANMTLINADTDEALDFGVELSYYHGVDEGESWSEGRPYSTVYIPRVPPGRYFLRVEPESDLPSLILRVNLVRDVFLKRVPLVVLLLLVLPMLWGWMRREVFENERWMESDHPRVVQSDDEDWEDDE